MKAHSHSARLTFLCEVASTPIHQRLIQKYQHELERQGHQVILIHSTEFSNADSLIHHINQIKADFCILIEPISPLSSFSQEAQSFLFELIQTPLVFIHYETTLGFEVIEGNLREKVDHLHKKLSAFKAVQDRSYHFCIENYLFLDLRSLGIWNVYQIYHASESVTGPNQIKRFHPPDFFQFDASFVGHILPGINEDSFEKNFPYSHFLYADFWNRFNDLGSTSEKKAIAFSEKFQNYGYLKVAFKYCYIALLNTLSLPFRGELIKRITTTSVDVIGGDPSYLNQKKLERKIQKETIRYHQAVFEPKSVWEIYQSSKVNINITSLQFDTTVVNRVWDIGGAGGFVLTDWKPDLAKFTSVANEISYRSIEELNAKLAYYLEPAHEKKRLEITEAFYQDVQRHCTYTALVHFILSKISAMPESQPEVLRLDLGCGPRKPEGFIGVDVYPGEGTDIVADLNQRFPFADSSVDMIRGHDVIEHLSDRLHTMNEIWRIAKPGAIIDLQVPSTDGRGAFQDPTHVSFWNINSFKYYCVEFPAYLSLCKTYGFYGAFSLISLTEMTSEDQVIHVRAILKAEKPIPEALNLLPIENLRTINLLLLPNWQAPEAGLAETLSEVFRAILAHPEKECIAVLIVLQDIEHEDANLFISSIIMDLLYHETVEAVDSEPEIILLDPLTPSQWQALQSYITAKVQLDPVGDRPITELPIVVESLAIADIPNLRWQGSDEFN